MRACAASATPPTKQRVLDAAVDELWLSKRVSDGAATARPPSFERVAAA